MRARTGPRSNALMSVSRKARLDVINQIMKSDEIVSVEVLALLFDPGGDLKKRGRGMAGSHQPPTDIR